MKKNVVLFVFIVLSSLAFSQEKEKLIVGIVYDGFIKDSNFVSSTIKTELNSFLGDNYIIEYPSTKQFNINSFNKKEISEKLDLLEQDKNTDIVIAAGVISSDLAINKMNLSKPIFAPFVVNTRSTSKNVSFAKNEIDLKSQIENLYKIKKYKNLKLITESNLIELFPDLKTIKNLEVINIEDKSIAQIYQNLEDSDGVIFTPLTTINNEEIKKLSNSLINKKISTFNLFTLDGNEYNTLAGYNYEKEFKKKIREIAYNISLYVKKDNSNNFSNQIDSMNPDMYLNMGVVEKTGIWPEWQILSEAKLINFATNEKTELQLGLKDLVETALKNNPKIKSLKKELENSKLDTDKAKSNYKPDINLELSGAIIDADRAESILTPAEKTLNAGISLTQVIFSEDINTNIDVQKRKNDIKKEELKKAELDLILETTEAYMSVLKAESYAKIQKNSFEIIKDNLDLAKAKKIGGISGQADIYRLESELSKNLSSLIDAILNIDITKDNLKRVINYDFGQTIEIQDVSIKDKEFLTSNPEILNYISNKNDVSTLINFMFKEAIKNSPDLKSVDYGIDIQKRLIKNIKNKRYMPTVALQAGYTISNIIAEGAGSESPDLSSIGNISDSNTQKAMADLIGLFGSPDEFSWSIGIGAKLPIYSGGETSIDKKIAENSIEILKNQKESASDYLEQQIAASLYQVISQYTRIQSAEVSLESATKAFNLIKDTYANGLSLVSDLISAQTSVFTAEYNKSAIEYDLLLSIMRVERISGQYYMLKTDEEKLNFEKEIKLGGIYK